MKKILKILLCTICCTVVCNNCGYSMQGHTQNQSHIKNSIAQILNKYPNSIKQIIPFPNSQDYQYFSKDYDEQMYIFFATGIRANLNQDYMNQTISYDKLKTKAIDKIKQLLIVLKQDTDQFINSKYYKESNNRKVFNLAWRILYTFVAKYKMIDDLWRKNSIDKYLQNRQYQIGTINSIFPNQNNNINLKNRELTAQESNEIEQAVLKESHLGLDNVGATCYMNATLQCLANIYHTSKTILRYNKKGKLNGNNKRLSKAYAEVLENIYCNPNQESYSPNKFKEVLGEMNTLFAPTAANDAKDLLIYFIEQMHNELNKSKETNTNLIMPDNMNPMNKQEVFDCFQKEFMNKYNSAFSDEFYGSNTSIAKCFGCNIEKYSTQSYSFIIFPLLEAEKYRNIACPYMMNKILNLQDCFNYNQKIDYFNGENQMYCNICQASKNAAMQTRLSTAPNTLILILNRGRANKDYKKPLEFWEEIDLTNYVELSDGNNKYFLSGVIRHMGDSGPSGHFIAFCRKSPNTKWYCYNDSIVSESSFQEILSCGVPYILFYSKKKSNTINVNGNTINNMQINQNIAMNNMGFNNNINMQMQNMVNNNPMMFSNQNNMQMNNMNQIMFNNGFNNMFTPNMQMNNFNNMMASNRNINMMNNNVNNNGFNNNMMINGNNNMQVQNNNNNKFLNNNVKNFNNNFKNKNMMNMNNNFK